MSWLIHSIETTVGDVASALEDVTVDYYGGEPKPYVDDQCEAAKRAAILLAESGVVGSPTHKVRITLSGHGNEGHVHDPAWANDCVTVSVSQV